MSEELIVEKACSRCKKILPASSYTVDTRRRKLGLRSQCKACAVAQSRDWEKAHPVEFALRRRAWTKTEKGKAWLASGGKKKLLAHPEKKRASRQVLAAIKSGKLTREPCSACGTTDKVQAHHDDYSRPLDVRWLCQVCHYREHGKQFITSAMIQTHLEKQQGDN